MKQKKTSLAVRSPIEMLNEECTEIVELEWKIQLREKSLQ